MKKERRRSTKPGIDDVLTLHPDIMKYWSDKNIEDPRTLKSGSNVRIIAECGDCTYVWTPRLGRLVEKNRCPACEDIILVPGINDLATKHPDLAKFVTANSPTSPHEMTFRSFKKVEVECKFCSRHETRFIQDYRGYCYVCIQRFVSREKSIAVLRPEILEAVSPNESLDLYSVPEFSTFEILFKCSMNHEYKQKIASWAIGSGCIVCLNKKILEGVNDCSTTHPEIARLFSPNSPLKPTKVGAGSGKYALFRCLKGHEWRSIIVNVTKGSRCNSCARAQTVSNLEKKVFDFVKTVDSAAKSSDRTIIKPLEIDILLEIRKIGFEVNGDYWHSDRVLLDNRGMKAREWHQHKKDLAKISGYRLYFIWERDIKSNYDNVKSAISNLILYNEESPLLNTLE